MGTRFMVSMAGNTGLRYQRKEEPTSVLSTVVSRSRAGNFLLFVAFRALSPPPFSFFLTLSLSLFSFTAARVIAPFRPFLARANLRQVPTASNRDDLRSNEYSRRSLDILERLFEPVRSDSSPFYRCSEPAKQSSRACSFDFSLARDSTARNESTSDLTRV